MKKGDYNPGKFEKKWQKKWTSRKIYRSKEDGNKPKSYILDMFPYPSGDGLHVGHPKGYIATDVVSRYWRMNGRSVLHPMGFDAFGLPAENYALKTRTNPADAMKKTVKRFKEQLALFGFDHDWSREVNTTDPKYYKWTQWIFLQLFKKGLAYESFEPINWCPSCKTGLANEDLENGRCERCGTPVEKKPMRQWVLKITDYAERLLRDLDAVDATNFPHVTDKNNPPQAKKVSVERLTVHALVRDPRTGKFIGLKWKKHPWTTFIVGGVEAGEDVVEAAKREVLEETGYSDLRFIKILGGPIRAEYFAAHKDENRVAITNGVLFELNSEKREPVKENESAKHEIVWLNQEDLNDSNLTCSELPFWLAGLEIKEELCFTNPKGRDSVREDLPFVERDAIMAIVKHWSEDKYLGLKWKKVNWQTLITGGPEGNQNPEEAALAEIREETGYVNLKLVKEIGRVHAKFFHVPKNVNRFAHFNVFYFELTDGKKEQVTKKERDQHEAIWVPAVEMSNFLGPESHRYMWAKFLSGRKPAGSTLLDWPESIKESQRNWIGKSEGSLIKFVVEYSGSGKTDRLSNQTIEVFTTRPDTLFGVTYVVLAPEHQLVGELLSAVENRVEVENYISKARQETEIERTDATKEKTGVELKGVTATNPANGEKVPVWISDYVLVDYGTGAVMAVPAHDKRDWDFAKKFNLPARFVVAPDLKDYPGEFVFRKDEPFIERKTIRGILKHWSDNKYAILRWKSGGPNTFISGGIEDGENPVNAAKREILEETGYRNAEFIQLVGGPVRAYFYAPVKKQNRIDLQQGILFKLKNDEKSEISTDELAKHSVEWVEADRVAELVKVSPVDRKLFARILEDDLGEYLGDGVIVNSGRFDGKNLTVAKKEITDFVGGRRVIKYKLRDWVFSRQRYWGEPIPLVHCERCGVVAVPEKELPVTLPKVKFYEPTGTGESPLAAITKWVNVKCPTCKGPAKRETNTMPQWAGSSWYYLRYQDPKNRKILVDKTKEKYWSPVDLYVGGAEHATRHLIYARFWHKFLYDLGAVSSVEPFRKLQNVGLIMGEDGRKMSKRFGNVINPDEIIRVYGADTLRLYEMFMGPFDQSIPWNSESIVGTRRFMEKVWRLADKSGNKEEGSAAEIKSLHKAVKKISEDIVGLRFNTAISSLMILVNDLEKLPNVSRSGFETLLKLLAPFAPHLTEELWHLLGNKKSIHISAWPTYDQALTIDEEVTIIIQINGKVRGSLTTATDTKKDDLERLAITLPEVQKWIGNSKILKVVVVPNRLVNLVLTDRS